jgi:cell division ATPase FtsA
VPTLSHDTVGEPVRERGIVAREAGLYFVGLHFLYAFSSTMIHGVARDAERIADTIAHRVDAAERRSGASTQVVSPTLERRT